MNERIVLSEAAAASLGIDSCLCDIVWNDEHAVVEYDSNLTHLDKGQHGYDKAKANALSDSGYRLVTITSSNIKSFEAMENTYEMVRNALCKRKRPKLLSKNVLRRRKVFNELFVFDIKMF